MSTYIPSPREWVREQVELYESSGGTKGTTLRDTGLPVILFTHNGNKTGAIRKSPLMTRQGRRQLRAGRFGRRSAERSRLGRKSARQSRHRTARQAQSCNRMRVREVTDEAERARRMGAGRSPPSRPMPTTKRRRPARSPSSSPSRTRIEKERRPPSRFAALKTHEAQPVTPNSGRLTACRCWPTQLTQPPSAASPPSWPRRSWAVTSAARRCAGRARS